jgi:parallel beta helix pectate lyase-like protein
MRVALRLLSVFVAIFTFTSFSLFGATAHALTFNVSRNDDPAPDGCISGVDCSLREAVIAANANAGPDTIVLQAGTTYILSIPGTGGAEEGDLDVTESLTIQGGDKETTVIDTDPNFHDRIFDVNLFTGPIDFTVSDLTLQHGEANGAGGLLGGAVFIQGSDPQGTFTNVIIQNNQSGSGGGGIYFNGGGSRKLVIQGSDILDNKVTNGPGGGVVCSSGQTACEISKSVFRGNESVGASGGGLHIATNLGTTSQHLIENTVFENNTAGTTGGGAFVTSTGGLKITGSHFTGNIANDGQGGGIDTQTNGDHVDVVDSVFENNESKNIHNGGGMSFMGKSALQFTKSQFLGNTANGGQGGGLYITGDVAELNIDQCVVQENTSGGNGGGIDYNNGLGSVHLTNSQLVGNITNNGGLGGGMYALSRGTVTIEKSFVQGNQSIGPGGGINCNVSGTTITCQISESMFQDNASTNGDGGGLVINTGGVTSDQNSVVKSVFKNNSASGNGGGLLLSSAQGLLMTDSQFLGNTAQTGKGGGVCVLGGDQSLNADKTIFQDNQSGSDGGGLFASVAGGKVIIEDSIFNNNQTSVSGSGQGGGLSINSKDGLISGSTFSANHADSHGGAALLSGTGGNQVTNSTFSGNSAGTDGGGLFLIKGGQVSFNNVTMVQNTAQIGLGGGFSNGGSGSVLIRNSLFYQNSAAVVGTFDCANSFIMSGGYNIFGPQADDANCSLVIGGVDPTDLYGVDPMIDILADNGGPTPTRALLSGSPAIDGGNPSGCLDGDNNPLTVDQRGFTRPAGANCDIGAYEFGSGPGGCVPTSTTDVTCDGVDDDCDGSTDEDFVSQPTSCGIGACAASGATSCVNGNVVDSCSPGTPTDEVCDGIDNDCDGQTDEGDSDGDGIADCQDNCPDDPNPNQSDVDADGTGDVCDDTPFDSVDGLCPCTGPVSGGTWKNHQEYLECVEFNTNQLRKKGFITKEQKNAIDNAAKKNSCGK